MAGLDAAAAVIAVLQLSTQVVQLCVGYSRDVKNASDDVARLRDQIQSLNVVLGEVRRLLDEPGGAKLYVSQNLREALRSCEAKLQALKIKLEPKKSGKFASRVGIRALKWPFQSKDVDKAINHLEQSEQMIHLALQVDQTSLVLRTDRKFDLAKLSPVEDAAFDSYNIDGLNAMCYPDTRVDLLRHIRDWAQDPQGKCIFWLNGMAGTGKSTVTRSIAQSFSDDRQLGASFFFKRGEGDRGHAGRLFPTLAAQLVNKLPAVGPFVSEAIDADPSITRKALGAQFDKLVYQPLSRIGCSDRPTSTVVIAVDALDECEQHGDVRTILQLLRQVQHIPSVSIRIFVTSRPELPVLLGFKSMPDDAHQDFVLHEISRSIIEHDINVFLKHELAKIRDDHNSLHAVDRQLPCDWPGERNRQILLDMAIPLFIFAATVCRFVGDSRWNPERRLATVIEYQGTSQASKLDRTYLPVLDQLLVDQTESEQENLVLEFRQIVGSIILLADPLSTASLARLLGVPQDVVDSRLDALHSVLSIPDQRECPVRLYHLSFRDFLLDTHKRGKSPFWIDERDTHRMIGSRCLEVMSGCLKKNICELTYPGQPPAEVDVWTMNKAVPPEVQYACRYWVYHLEQSRSGIGDQCQLSQLSDFLHEHFLHWLEALSLMQKAHEAISMIIKLQTLLKLDNHKQISEFLHDARRFVLKNQRVIALAPLQTYSSALIFAPKNSLVRNRFRPDIDDWIQDLPEIRWDWNAELQTLEGHTDIVWAVAFSPDGTLVASGSEDCTIRLWHPGTGMALQTLEVEPIYRAIVRITFSPDNKLLASATYDGGAVLVWDTSTGTLLRTLQGHPCAVFSLVFSADARLLATATGSPRDPIIRFWDTATGTMIRILEGQPEGVYDMAFSANMFVSSSEYEAVWLWDLTTGAVFDTLDSCSGGIRRVALSPNGTSMAFHSVTDDTVWLWDLVTRTNPRPLESYPPEDVKKLIFSYDGKVLARVSTKSVCLWNLAADTWTALDIVFFMFMPVELSPDGSLLALSTSLTTFRLMDLTLGTRTDRQTLESKEAEVTAMAFSPDGRSLASASFDHTVRLWELTLGTAKALQTLEGHTGPVWGVAFSPDGEMLASASSDHTVRLWDRSEGAAKALQTLKGHTSGVSGVAFSSDNKLLASSSYDKTIRLWDSKQQTSTALHVPEGSTSNLESVAFSPDSHLLVASTGYGEFWLWDAITGTALQTVRLGHELADIFFATDDRFPETCQIAEVALGDLGNGDQKGIFSVAPVPKRYRLFAAD